ncbi:O-methyltransferase [Caldalkalibacillus salinus]|uniref:O-methyltransferase n=1 Tax=Caldalkalibacillus salinus TaxID=2803787 RepID=UPI0019243F8D|nr:O-methyltransferase [Caldalkalibacillus salinus]
MIVSAQLQDYILSLTPSDDPILTRMEQLAHEERIPIIDRSAIQLISVLLQNKDQVHNILEVGTAIGYSTLWLAKAAPQAMLDTIEREEDKIKTARRFLSEAGVIDRVRIHHADATRYADHLQGRQYDCIFIDAAKGQYHTFFESYSPLLKKDGMIITDNVFFHGEVLQDHVEQKRIRSLVKKIKSYNEWLANHDGYDTSFVPIGDGLAISIKRREKK